MNWVIVAFLLMIVATLAFGAWVVIRQERYARHHGRHHCPHAPVLGQAHVHVVTPGTVPSVECRLSQHGSQQHGPVYDLHLGLQAGGVEC